MNNTFKKIVQYIWFLRGKIPFLNFPLPCILPFGSLYLAYGDGMGLMFFSHRPYEKNEWQFISRFLKPGMKFFDVGANQGFYTLLAAKKVGLGGKVFSFEPVPSQLSKLRRNIKINLLHNTTTEQMALGSKEENTNMYVCLGGDEALSSLRFPSEDANIKKEVIKVQVTTLDNYISKNKIPSVDFVKIDVEGGELNVLKGGVNMLKDIRPILMCEVQDIRTRQWGYRASEIYKFLEDYNYSWFSVASDGSLVPSIHKENHEAKGENLIALPKEKINLFKIKQG
jgi:FkbM family methyltransferase